MQIKLLKSLLLLYVLVMPMVCNGAISDWFKENCKQITDNNGLSERMKDIKQNSDFKTAKFYTGLCAGKKSPNGKSYCVELFKDSQVHDMRQAIQIAKDYAHEVNGNTVTCHNDYWSCKDNDDHILCSTANNSAHYEFIFDDITEKSDAKYKKGIIKSYCKMFFGEDVIVKNDDKVYEANNYLTCWENYNEWYENNVFQGRYYGNPEKCTKYAAQTERLSKLLSDIYGFRLRHNGCNNWGISFGTGRCVALEKYDGIDNTIFKLQQVDLSSDIEVWLGQYVERVLNRPVKFRCELSAKTCLTGESKNPRDDYLSCYIDNEPISFQFDDLSESWESYRKGSKQAMECINQDGIFDGSRCRGINQEDCVSSKFAGAPVEWNGDLQACTLKDAAYVSKLNRGAEIATTVGVAAGITVATIATGGGTVMVLLAAGGAVAATGSQASISVERDKVDTFTTELLACANRDCLRKEFQWFIDHGSNYINNLTPGQIDAIDRSIAKKLDTIKMSDKDDEALANAFESSKNKSGWERCTGDALQLGKCTFDAASIILDFLPVTKMALKAPETLGVFVSKIGTKMPNTAKMLMRLRQSKIIKQGVEMTDKIDTMNDIVSGATGLGVL